LLTTNVGLTGSTLQTNINTLTTNVGLTGSTLQTNINNLSNTYATISNVALTGSTLDTKINNLSGSSVLLYGDQSIGGVKTFRDNVYINNLYITGTETIVSTNNFNVQSPYVLLNLTGGAVDGGIFFVTGTGLTGANDTGPIIGFDHSTKFKFGFSTRNSDLSTLPDIASVQDITTYSGFVDGKYATISNVALTGSTLQTNINTLTTNVGLTGSTLSTNLALTGSTLQTNINTLTTNVGLSGSTLQTNINTLTTNVGLSGSTLQTNINTLTTNVGLTGSTLNTKIDNLSGYINSSSSNIVFTTGNQTISGIKTFVQDATFGDTGQGDFLVISGNNFTVYGSGNFTSGLFVNSSPVLTGSSTLYATTVNLASTGSTLDNKINNLSGVSVLTFGNQTISGVKTFATGAIYLDSSIISTKSGISANAGIGGVGGNIYLDGGNSYSTDGPIEGGNGGYLDLRGGGAGPGFPEEQIGNGGDGGWIELKGGGITQDAPGGNGGYIQANGDYQSNGGFIELNAGGQDGHGGYIKLNGAVNGASGGYIEANGYWDPDLAYPGGFINLNSTANGPGGSLNLSEGGGSIDTRAKGKIEFGVDSTRTILSGTASENRTIYLPDANGTLVLDSSLTNVVYTTGNQTISGVKTFIGNHNISGNLNVTGNSNIRGTLDVTGLVVSGLGNSFILKSPNNQNSVYFNPTQNGNAGALFSNYVYSSTIGSRNDDNFTLAYGGGGTRNITFQGGSPFVNRAILDSNGNFGIASGISSVPSRFYVSGNSVLQGNLTVSGDINISGNYDIYSQIENAKKLAIAYAIAL
jgi:cytoskeletal protein CcmA (bactofilin family)